MSKDENGNDNLSKREHQLLTCIIQYKKAHDGVSPTIREMMDATEMVSTSVVDFYLRKLEVAGYIQRTPGKSRMIQVSGYEWKMQEAQ